MSGPCRTGHPMLCSQARAASSTTDSVTPCSIIGPSRRRLSHCTPDCPFCILYSQLTRDELGNEGVTHGSKGVRFPQTCCESLPQREHGWEKALHRIFRRKN